jgi:hypothetical protein
MIMKDNELGLSNTAQNVFIKHVNSEMVLLPLVLFRAPTWQNPDHLQWCISLSFAVILNAFQQRASTPKVSAALKATFIIHTPVREAILGLPRRGFQLG